jgi:hypothetical protein
MDVRTGVYCYTIQIVNIGLIGDPTSEDFILVDAGMPRSVNDVLDAIEKRVGAVRQPRAA